MLSRRNFMAAYMETSQEIMSCKSGDLDSLLEFTAMASAFINSVLKKPLKSRRKVNHRKFLQKQLGAYSQYKSVFVNDTEESQDSCRYFYHLDSSSMYDSSKEAKRKYRDGITTCSSEKQSLEKLFNPEVWRRKPKQSRQNCSLRHRELPESFWREPKNYNQTCSSTSTLMRLDRTKSCESEDVETFDFWGAEFDELLEKISEDSDVLSTSSGRCTSLSDSCSVDGKEPGTPSSKSVFDHIWSVPADIVNLTHSDEGYFL